MVLKECAETEGRAEAECKRRRNGSISLCSAVTPVLCMGSEMLIWVRGLSSVLCYVVSGLSTRQVSTVELNLLAFNEVQCEALFLCLVLF